MAEAFSSAKALSAGVAFARPDLWWRVACSVQNSFRSGKHYVWFVSKESSV